MNARSFYLFSGYKKTSTTSLFWSQNSVIYESKRLNFKPTKCLVFEVFYQPLKKTRAFLVTLFISLFICFSCGKKKEAVIPKNILPKDTMSMVLEDMEIIESGLNTLSNGGKDVKPLINPYYKKLLEKYRLDSLQLKTSLDFYVGNPEILDKIYQHTLDELVQKQAKNKYLK